MAEGMSAGSPMALLRSRFVLSLRKKEWEIEELIGVLTEEGLQHEHLTSLFYFAHNIVGIAATYGFEELGEAAAHTESLLNRVVTDGSLNGTEGDVLVSADMLAEELRRSLDYA